METWKHRDETAGQGSTEHRRARLALPVNETIRDERGKAVADGIVQPTVLFYRCTRFSPKLLLLEVRCTIEYSVVSKAIISLGRYSYTRGAVRH